MEKEMTSSLYEDKLESYIDALREVLNELCCTIDGPESNIEKLNVSCQLDKLIVEYMNIKKNNYSK